MEFFDLEKLENTIVTVSRLAEGKDPVWDVPAPEDTVLNSPEMIRCLFFIKEVLQAVTRNNGKVGEGSKNQRRRFPLECLEKFVYEEDKPITRFLTQLKDLAEDPEVRGIPSKPIMDWLKSKGFLEETTDALTGKRYHSVTPEGKTFGIYMEQRTTFYGREYTVVLYSRAAQEFIVNNMEAILNGEVVS